METKEFAEKIWDSLSNEQRLGATAFIFSVLCEHARSSGTFRYLIYGRLGFDLDAYMTLFEAGGMDISNEFNLPPLEEVEG